MKGIRKMNNSLPKEALPHLDVDMVNSPPHYASGGIECIDAMISSQGTDAVKDFCLCNAFKYIWRTKNKNGIEDVDKAIWYLNKYKELSKGQN